MLKLQKKHGHSLRERIHITVNTIFGLIGQLMSFISLHAYTVFIRHQAKNVHEIRKKKQFQ